MNQVTKHAAVAALVLAIGGVAVADAKTSPAGGNRSQRAAATKPLPRLVDVGAGKCIPCKAMAPILSELKKEYAGRMDVQFIEVWRDPSAGKPYRISMIPTQIFFGADGRELARHEGFMGKAEILAQWKALGVEF